MAKGKSLKKALTKHLTAEQEKSRRASYEERQRENEKQKAHPKAKSKAAAAAVKKQKERSSYQPYHNGQRVLLVGEGNFSFAVAFAKRFPASAKMSIATAYDTEEEAKRKYSDTAENVKLVRSFPGFICYDSHTLKKIRPSSKEWA